jgi:hypothetical protein
MTKTDITKTKLMNDINAHVRFPQDVLRVECRFGKDSAGEPAVWIILVVHDDLKPSKSKIERLRRVAEEVRSVIHNESTRWPFVEIASPGPIECLAAVAECEYFAIRV